MKFPKTQRLLVSILTSTCLVSQSSFGAVSGQNKILFNTLVKEFTKTDLQTLVKNYGHFLDDKSLGFMESLLKKHHGAKIDSIRVEPLNDKKRPDAHRVTLSIGGTSLQMELAFNDPENIKINGANMSLIQLLNLAEASSILSKNDARFADTAKRIRGFQAPPSNRAKVVAEKMVRMDLQEKSEAFYILRKNHESAMKVMALTEAPVVAANEGSVLNPLFASLIAQAAKPNVGDFCGAGGNLTTYQNGKYTDASGKVQTGIHCDPYQQIVNPPPPYHGGCQDDQPLYQQGIPISGRTLGSVSGRKAACPPLFYGGWEKNGQTFPHCQPTDVADFTPNGTLNCGAMSPVREPIGSAEYRADTRRNLERYLKMKGASTDEVARCLNKENKYNAGDEKCKNLFETYMEEFGRYKLMALQSCDNPKEVAKKTKDFEAFCTELRKRSFSWESYVEAAPQRPPTTPTDGGSAACTAVHGTAKPGKSGVSLCYCGETLATQNPDGSYEPCPPNVATTCAKAGGTWTDNQCKCKETGIPAVKKGNSDFEVCASGISIACTNAHGKMVPDELGAPVCYCDKSRPATQKPDGNYESCESTAAAAVSESKFPWGPILGIGAAALLANWLFNRGGGKTPYNPPPYPVPLWLTEGNNGKTGGTGSAGSVRSTSPVMSIPKTPTGTDNK